jgi:branched-chain amino acid transport system permease protein
MLVCNDVVRYFGGLAALSGASLKVNEGEIVGLVGPNGSGKSTLINVITGQYEPTQGSVAFLDTPIGGKEPHFISHLGIARTYQIPRPFPTLTTLENVEISCIFGRKTMGTAAARDAASHWLEFTGLGNYLHYPISKLNLHQRKFLELARALATEPKLLMLDEVLAGLHPSEIDESIEMIKKIHESGVTIVIVEHLMRVVTGLSTRMVVLDQGKVIAEGSPQDVMQDSLVISAYLGKDYAQSQ